jgi:hypothetical protein
MGYLIECYPHEALRILHLADKPRHSIRCQIYYLPCQNAGGGLLPAALVFHIVFTVFGLNTNWDVSHGGRDLEAIR